MPSNKDHHFVPQFYLKGAEARHPQFCGGLSKHGEECEWLEFPRTINAQRDLL
jgi:hypothetical protein